MKARFIFIIAVIATLVVFTMACSKKTEQNEYETNVATDSTATIADTSATSTTDTTSTAVTSTAPLEGPDKEFADKAAKGGNSEVALGNLMVQKATSPDVKSFAQRMVDDHSKAGQELSQLASAKGMTAPAEPSEDAKKEIDKLDKLSGAELDKEYMSFMVNDHKKDVEEFQKQSTDAKDADLKAWVAKTLPTLQDHLRMAEETATKVGAK